MAKEGSTKGTSTNSIGAPKNSAAPDRCRGLGRWVFDKKTRKRKYISLTGKTLTGASAVEQSKRDKVSDLHPANTARAELRYLMTSVAPRCLDDFFACIDSDSPGLEPIIAPDPLDISQWGVPLKVVDRYCTMGVSRLFPWQVDCLGIDNGKVLRGGNLIYSAPTSGGKTLVAEMLMLRKLGTMTPLNSASTKENHGDSTGDGSKSAPSTCSKRCNGTIFFVVPFVALAEEKAEHFRNVFSDMFIGVKTYHGEDNSALTEDVDIAVCTIERANIMLTALLDEGREEQLRMVVVDEMHLVSDPHRGFLLEVMLSKVKYLMGNTVQIVGMSATLPNIADLARWLDASLYTTEFRPVDLSVQVCYGRQLYTLSKLEIDKDIGDNNRNREYASSAEVASCQRNVTMDVVAEITCNEQQQQQYTRINVNQNVEQDCTQYKPTSSSSSSSLSSAASSSAVMPVNASLFRQDEYDFVFHRGLANIPGISATSSSSSSSSQQVQTQSRIHTRSSSSRVAGSSQVTNTVADTDGLFSLCLEPYLKGKSVLLFLPSKSRCSAVAKELARVIRQLNLQVGSNRSDIADGSCEDADITDRNDENKRETTKEVRNKDRDRSSLRTLALAELRLAPVRMCDVLKDAVPCGVAYHHAGLCAEERAAIEKGFRNGAISILCTTSTLAAGVNLPANRVIIREPQMGSKPLSVSSFRQMCGRAGRLGLDTHGEAVLMIHSNLEQRLIAKRLLACELEPLQSSLHTANGGGLEKLLLELVCCGRLTHEEEVEAFVQCTLMNVQHDRENVVAWTERALLFLRKHRFLNHTSDRTLAASPLGRATALSCIPPTVAVHIINPLEKARKKLILTSGFHLVFLVTPPHTAIEPAWDQYEGILSTLCRELKGVGEVLEYLGVRMEQLMHYKRFPPAYQSTDDEVRFYRRLYSAIVLFKLTEEMPLNSVGRLMTVNSGQIQTLQKESATFCAMTTVFCRKLNWDLLASCLETYVSRLGFGVREDLLPLVRLGNEMTNLRARAFVKSGLCTPEDIVRAGSTIVTQILVNSLPFNDDAPLQVGKAHTNKHRESRNSHQQNDDKENGDSVEMKICSTREATPTDPAEVKVQQDPRFLACHSLAQKILFRAREAIEGELTLYS